MQNLLVHNKSIKQQASVVHLRLVFKLTGSFRKCRKNIPQKVKGQMCQEFYFYFQKIQNKVAFFQGYYHVVLIWCDIYLHFQSLQKGKVESRTAPHQHEE